MESMLSMIESRSSPDEVLMLIHIDSRAAILPSRIATCSDDIGVRFQSSVRNSHLTPAMVHR